MKSPFRKFSHCAVMLLWLGACAVAQQGKSKTDLSGHYEGTAKNAASEVIPVAMDLTEKDGAVTGNISSSHGDFPITSGSHQGKTVTLQFDAEGTSGTISLEVNEEKLVGTWSAGDDSGPLDVKKVTAQQGGAKGNGEKPRV